MKLSKNIAAAVFIATSIFGCDTDKNEAGTDTRENETDSVGDTSSNDDVSTTEDDTDTDSYEDNPIEPECIATCEKWNLVVDAVGCFNDCSCSTPCQDFANAWVLCVLKDPLNMCMCDAYNILNCEGSFKDDEGSAACYDEYSAWYECGDQSPPGGPTSGGNGFSTD
jgi:hypothetical protein